jgi:hypothetical protein
MADECWDGLDTYRWAREGGRTEGDYSYGLEDSIVDSEKWSTE